MIAGFEAMYEEMGGDNSLSEGEREGGLVARDMVADPRASNTVDLSSTRELVNQVSQEEQGSDVPGGGVELLRGSGLDVEEGEVDTDSSDETGGMKKKVIHVYVL